MSELTRYEYDQVVPDEAPLQPGYYECVEPDDKIGIGEIVYLKGFGGGYVYFICNGKEYGTKEPGFRGSFVWQPRGEEIIAERYAALLSETTEVSREAREVTLSLAGFNPGITDGGFSGTDETGVALASPEQARGAIKRLRNNAMKLKEAMATKKQALVRMMENQKMILEAKLGDLNSLQEYIDRAHEAIWSVELYLGTHEEFHELRMGEPADADEPITIRQNVLWMDEECAVAAEEGGIEGVDISGFDAWLQESWDHVDQVIPEKKALVCLKPRRKTKDYENPWLYKKMFEADKQTYFLLRNGEKLYRMVTSFDAGDTLLPKLDEYENLFTSSSYDFREGRQVTRQLTPGTAEYAKAEKIADARTRHYMRVGLILQGILDRTPIFHPLPGPIQVTDPAEYGRTLRVVNDAEKLLGDGRERFKDWLKRINSHLRVGTRIIGTFDSYGSGLGEFFDESRRNSRLFPHTAKRPGSLQLYTIEEKRRGMFVIRYPDAEVWEWRGGYRPAKKRASCELSSEDNFILNFDEAEVEDMQRFLRSRIDRVHYLQLFPLLKKAIQLKREEKEAEKPFHRLLAGEIVKRYDVDLFEAEDAVPEIVRWYKFKNKYHRALTSPTDPNSDEAKALRMIVGRFEAWRMIRNDCQRRMAGEAKRVQQMILDAHPNTLMIAHTQGPNYVAWVPHNDEDVFAMVQEWTVDGMKSSVAWQILGHYPVTWHAFYGSDRLANWKFCADPNAHLTDTEFIEFMNSCLPKLSDEYKPLMMTAKQRRLHIYYVKEMPVWDPEHLLTGRWNQGTLIKGHCYWSRDNDTVTCSWISEHHYNYGGAFGEDGGWTGPIDPHEFIIQEWPDNIRDYKEQRSAFDALKDKREAMWKIVYAADKEIDRQYSAMFEAKEFGLFMEEYGDPELWDGHKKTIEKRIPKERPGTRYDEAHRALCVLVENGREPAGETLRDLLAAAKDLSPSWPDLRDKIADEWLDFTICS